MTSTAVVTNLISSNSDNVDELEAKGDRAIKLTEQLAISCIVVATSPDPDFTSSPETLNRFVRQFKL